MTTRDSFQLIGGIFLFVALLTHYWFFFALGCFFLFLLVAHRWWQKRISRFVTITCSSPQSRVMPHTPTTMRIAVQNRSILPLPATKLSFTLPMTVEVEGADVCREASKQLQIQVFMHVPPRSQVIRELTLIPRKRGVLWLTDMAMELLSPFATEPCVHTGKTSYSLLVYPEITALPPYQKGSLEPLGKRLSMQRMQDDPAFIRGVRHYLPGDRQKTIDWKATAKTAQLQTRLYEYTSSQKWVIIGHMLPMYEPRLQRFNDLENERTISAIASAAARFRREKTPHALYLNVRQRGRELFHLAEGGGKAQYVHILTQLAKMNHFVPTSLSSVFRRLEASTHKLSILLVSSRFDGETSRMAERLMKRGHEVTLLDASADTPFFRPLQRQWHSGMRASRASREEREAVHER
ncbi:UNVERIFIED_CONTAM: uncharacterized protein (DUF58 family) [Brevibacillus sp. OAP136]